MDASPNVEVSFPALQDKTFFADETPLDDLAKFLSRPVKIFEVNWTEGVVYPGSYFSPWHLFFNTPAIKRKIDNYAFLSCNLHLKVVVNASPFYYGAMVMSYDPIPGFTLVPQSPAAPRHMMERTQRPHVWIYPQNNQAGELILPFFWFRNWLDITTNVDLLAIGRMDVQEVVALRHANAVAGGTISIQVYAWAENVHLTGPTFSLAIQSGAMKKVKTGDKSSTNDEYTGPISRVASFVSNVSSKLTSIPMFGPYARATQIGASAVAGIASMFGYTNVPVVADVMPMRNLPFGNFANSEIGAPVQKLTLDPKNELTLDPRTVGLSGGDELSICYLVCKESWVNSALWEVSDGTGIQLMQVPINPMMVHSIATGVNQTSYNTTPMGLVSQFFRYWRGNIVVRIKAVCTQYHKGRLRISWDPLYVPGVGDDNTTVAFNKIVDLSPELDMEIEIDFLQARHWLKTLPVIAPAIPRMKGGILIAAGKNTLPASNNGLLTVQVLNELSGPTTTPVELMLFVRGTPTLEFQTPTNHLGDIGGFTASYFTVQSGQMSKCEEHSAGSESSQETDSYAVYAGEVVRSMRVLLHRTSQASSCSFMNTAGVLDYVGAMYVRHSPFPALGGFNPQGVWSAIGLNSGVRENYDYEVCSPLTMLAPCFAGWRGSMVWHYNANRWARTNFNSVTVSRTDADPFSSGGKNVPTFGFSNTVVNGPSAYASGRRILTTVNNELSPNLGAELFATRTQSGISVGVPFYANTRFHGTAPVLQNWGIADDDSANQLVSVEVLGCPVRDNDFANDYVLDRYYEAGTDFNLFFFMSVPEIRLHANPVTAENP
jgi:hypothetical protein